MYPIPTLSSFTKERISRPFIQGHVTEALFYALENPNYAAPNLSRWFRSNRTLGSRDRKIVSEIVYTIIRYEQWFVRAQILDKSLESASDFSGIFEWWSNSDYKPQFDFGTHLSVPDAIAGEWFSRIQDPSAFVHHIQQRAPLDIRVHGKRTTRQKVHRKLIQQGIPNQIIANTSNGLRIIGTYNIQQTGLYNQGLIEIQDAASQLFIEQLAPYISSKTTILDLCAGAGGKSLALAALGAKVYVNEPRSNALKELKRRVKRAGSKIIDRLPDKPVDIVIVDAPCSGSGRLRREPTLRWKWKEHSPSKWPPIQNDILKNAVQYVKSTGRIAYGVCSLMELENQHSINGWRANRETIWGHNNNCDGFAWTMFEQENL